MMYLDSSLISGYLRYFSTYFMNTVIQSLLKWIWFAVKMSVFLRVSCLGVVCGCVWSLYFFSVVCGSVWSQTASVIYRDLCDVELLVLMFCYGKVLFWSVWLSGFMVCWTVTSLSHWARNWANCRHGSNRRLRKSDFMLVSMQSGVISCKMALQHSMNRDFVHSSNFSRSFLKNESMRLGLVARTLCGY